MELNYTLICDGYLCRKIQQVKLRKGLKIVNIHMDWFPDYLTEGYVDLSVILILEVVL